MNMTVIRSGFDGLDIAIQAKTPTPLAEALETAQAEARETKKDATITYNGLKLDVAETGARGGYAYRIDTGITGETWFFKRRNNTADQWGIRVSFKGVTLALYGLDGAENIIHETLAVLGVVNLPPYAFSIGRVDYAVDILAPDFELHPDRFVMHSQLGLKVHQTGASINDSPSSTPIGEMDSHGRSGRIETVTIGKMPGRQMQIYDKRAEVLQKRKVQWPELWNAALAAQGLPQLDMSDPHTSRVWRVELRAGKRALKDKFGITTFNDLRAKLPAAFQAMSVEIRLTRPTKDSNRSRWPVDPLYALAQQEIAKGLNPIAETANPDRVREIMIKDKIAMLEKQAEGCIISAKILQATFGPIHQ